MVSDYSRAPPMRNIKGGLTAKHHACLDHLVRLTSQGQEGIFKILTEYVARNLLIGVGVFSNGERHLYSAVFSL